MEISGRSCCTKNWDGNVQKLKHFLTWTFHITLPLPPHQRFSHCKPGTSWARIRLFRVCLPSSELRWPMRALPTTYVPTDQLKMAYTLCAGTCCHILLKVLLYCNTEGGWGWGRKWNHQKSVLSFFNASTVKHKNGWNYYSVKFISM